MVGGTKKRSSTGSTCTWDDPWPSWTRYTNSATATTANLWYDPWPMWTSTNGAATTTWDDCNIWPHWVRSITTQTIHAQRDAQRVVSQASIREPTAEELQARLRREQEYRAQAEKRLLEEKEAKEKAEALLLQFLTPEQRESLAKRDCFQLESISQDGTRKRYEIRRGRAQNIYLLGPDGKPVERFCVHPSEFVPDADTMLAQKLLIEGDEALFLRTANRSPVLPTERARYAAGAR